MKQKDKEKHSPTFMVPVYLSFILIQWGLLAHIKIFFGSGGRVGGGGGGKKVFKDLRSMCDTNKC